MPLIACPDCSTEVSDRAPTCPKCGAPIAGRAEAVATGVSLTTTQQTSKQLKLHMLLASLCFWVGLVWLIFSSTADAPSFVAIILLLVGIVWYISTRSRIWWHHK
jgi:uncharacterized membrane protein YvbJ